LFELDSGLPTLLKLSLTFAAIGTAALAVAFVETIANLAQRATSWIPFFGSSIDNGIKHGVNVITNRLGQQYNGIDQEVGYGLGQLATVIRLMGADVLGVSFATYKLTQLLAALSHRPAPAPITKTTQTTVNTHTKQVVNVTRKVVNITEVVRGARSPVQPQQIHALQAQVKHLRAEVVELRHEIKSEPHPSTLAQAIPITALGLAGLGLNASRCEGAREFNKALCEAGPQGLGRLLSLLGLAGFALGLVELADKEKDLIGDVVPIVKDIWRV
jgi:hypothetical protein